MHESFIMRVMKLSDLTVGETRSTTPTMNPGGKLNELLLDVYEDENDRRNRRFIKGRKKD